MTAWDSGVTWFKRRTVAPTEWPLDLAYVRDQVLRVVNGSYDDSKIDALIREAMVMAEERTDRSLMLQTWELVLDRFPCGAIVLPRPPFIAVSSLTYVDQDGVTQSLSVGSPSDFQTIPSGHWTRAMLLPNYSEVWPTARYQQDAVTVTFTAGYSDQSDPQLELIKSGMEVYIAERYKQRTLSMSNAGGTMIAPLALKDFWRPVP